MNQINKDYMNILKGLEDVPQDEIKREEAEA